MSNWKENQEIEDYREFKEEQNLIIRKDTLAVVAVVLIAIGIIYIAYAKYEERRKIEEATKQVNQLFGSAIKMANNANKEIYQNIRQENQNRILKREVNNLENEIRRYKIDKYYDHKEKIRKKEEALKNMREQLKIK